VAPTADQSNRAPFPTPRLSLCLDFANTCYGRGSTPTESLHGFSDLLLWCAEKVPLAKSVADELGSWSDGNAESGAQVFNRAIEIRESIYRIFGGFASERETPLADIENLNRAIAAAPLRSLIQRAEDGFAWSVPKEGGSHESLLAPVLWSAGDLLTGKYLHRVRLCANHKCLWLFLDDSLSGRRRWCSMSACGNRAKTQRHYLRRKAG